jgi:hypothetical protein
MHSSGGTSQKQATDVLSQGTSCSNASVEKQLSASGLWQQSAFDEQYCAMPEQTGGGAGGVQIPELQVSSELQQSFVRHEEPVWAHVEMSPLEQVPLVSPAGTAQVSSAQQSSFTVQLSVASWHDGTQKPPEQVLEQHWDAEVQASPFGAQAAPQVPDSHEPKQQLGFAPPQACPWRAQSPITSVQAQPSSGMSRQLVPSQHGSTVGALPTEQIEPSGMQDVAAQRSTPLASGTQGAFPQH